MPITRRQGWLLLVYVAVHSKNLSVHHFQIKFPAYSLHDIVIAMLDVFFVVVPRFNPPRIETGPKLLPPDEHAVLDVPLFRREVAFPMSRKAVDLVGSEHLLT